MAPVTAERSRALDSLLARLSKGFGEALRTDEAALEAVSGDESGLAAVRPGAVVLAQNSEQVATVAREAAELGVGLVPRGGGTGKAGGGASPSQIRWSWTSAE